MTGFSTNLMGDFDEMPVIKRRQGTLSRNYENLCRPVARRFYYYEIIK